MASINLNELTHGRVRNLSGHERGSAARAKFLLDELDKSNSRIDVELPPDLEGMTTSFFQGMFAASVKAAGSDFLDHYRFHASPALMEQILRGIEKVQTKRGSALS